MKRAARRDAVEHLIVLSLERRGYAVAVVSDQGHPDLLVSRGDAVWLIECKDPGAPNRTRERAVYRGALVELPRTLTPAQAKWWKRWLAAGGKMPAIVSTVDEALAAVMPAGSDSSGRAPVPLSRSGLPRAATSRASVHAFAVIGDRTIDSR